MSGWSEDETGMAEDRCLFPGECLMPGDHLSGECHTVEMMETQNREHAQIPEWLDEDGYPTEIALQCIRDPGAADCSEWWGYVNDAWNHDFGRIDETDTTITLVTGGWSGNEDVIGAMMECWFMWATLWLSSECGGRHTFEWYPGATRGDA